MIQCRMLEATRNRFLIRIRTKLTLPKHLLHNFTLTLQSRNLIQFTQCYIHVYQSLFEFVMNTPVQLFKKHLSFRHSRINQMHEV